MMSDEQKASVQANINCLLERSASTDIPLLLKVKENAKRIADADPSAANLAAVKSASKMLADAVAAQNAGGNFANLQAVLAYLQDQGRKISQSQIYKDLKKGFLRREKDKSFTRRNVDAYASTLPILAMPEAVTDELQDLGKRELEEKIARLREQREDMAYDRSVKQGKYIKREDVALELASRASVLGVGLRSAFQLVAPELVKMVGGDLDKVNDLVTAYENNLAAALTEYSKPMDFRVEYLDAISEEIRLEQKNEPEEDESSE